MGINIKGYIEVRWDYMLEREDGSPWQGVVNLSDLLSTRDYLMYHSLFGIRDDTDFEPVAPQRGLPADFSDAVLYTLEIERGNEETSLVDNGYEFGHTWVTFQELQAVDWEETAMTGTAWEYKDGKPANSGYGYPADHPRRLAGVDFEEDGAMWKFERITRRESLGKSGPLLYDLMEVLAKHQGAEHVRAVVWFD